MSIEILDNTPQLIQRPLCAIGDYAYAAIWPYLQITQTETVNDKGETLEHNPPLVTRERRLCIVRSDGIVFGAGEHALSELALEVNLNETPPDDKLWSTRGLKAFVELERPDADSVFNQVVEVIDRFIDFDRSLAPQRTMSEFVACYIFATWFLDAFNVIGFVWPNGESGSGKTQLLSLIAELSYLGQLILAGGSYASLRDLAEYGATLCFDDAENVADSRRIDPDKRALLLAGNRRGNTISVKEPIGTRKWRTRLVPTFCARAFSAINTPDRVLASRSIIIPLIRTPDRYKANADPLNYAIWPHDRITLIDSLWALALENLCELSAFESRVNESARLTGRVLEPWLAILTVALWLQERGVQGLYDRLESLSVAYQTDQSQNNIDSLVPLTIHALAKCLKCDIVTLCDGCDLTQDNTTDTKALIRVLISQLRRKK